MKTGIIKIKSCGGSLKVRSKRLYDLLTRRLPETFRSCTSVLVQREEQNQIARSQAEAIVNKCRLTLSRILT